MLSTRKITLSMIPFMKCSQVGKLKLHIIWGYYVIKLQ